MPETTGVDAMTKEIQKVSRNQSLQVSKIELMISEYSPNDLAEIVQDVATDITIFDLARVRFPTGDSTNFTVESSETEKAKVASFTGIIIGQKPMRAYYEKPFSGNGQPPDCSSHDGITGSGNPGGACDTCPLAQFGSSTAGDGSACKQLKALFILTEDSMLPMLMVAPTMSVKSIKRYMLSLAGKGMKYNRVVTEFALATEKSSTNIEYPQLKLRAVSRLSDNDSASVAEFSKLFAPMWTRIINSAEFNEVLKETEQSSQEFNPEE